MTSKVSTHDTAITTDNGGIGELIAGLLRALRKHWEIRRSVAHLSNLDDRMLKDIGIARSEIQFVVRNRPSKS